MPTFRQVTDGEAVRHQEISDHAFDDAPGPTDYDGAGDLDVGDLSKPYVGTVGAETARERGDLTGDDATVEALSALFPSRQVYLADFF